VLRKSQRCHFWLGRFPNEQRVAEYFAEVWDESDEDREHTPGPAGLPAAGRQKARGLVGPLRVCDHWRGGRYARRRVPEEVEAMTLHSFRHERRHFLRWASASAAFLAAHGCTASEGPHRPGPGERPETGPRIVGLELLSSAPPERMKEFYHKTLGLRLVDERRDRLTVAAGPSRLTFVTAGPEDGKPFYHFAFNIPENKIRGAHRWQKERTPLLPIPARLRDPQYPDDVVDYRHWNAHSVFFLDPAGNVVEYIARHDLKNAARGEFSPEDILCASEIGLIVDDVAATATRLTEVVGVEQYRGGSDQFTALGDEHGLLLVMKRGRVLSFDAPQKKEAGVFRTSASVRGVRRTNYRVPRFPYEVSVEA
jgi:catechol-2,3-dioxygenase